MRADDPPLPVRSTDLCGRDGRKRRVHVLPVIGALVHVVLDVDASQVVSVGAPLTSGL